MDFRGILAIQIKKSNDENQDKKRQAALLAKEKKEKDIEKERIRTIRQKNKFENEKNKLENSGFRQIMTTLVQELNSPDERYSILRDKIVTMVRDNPHSQINDQPVFSVSEPYNFEEGCEYRIFIQFLDSHHNFRTLFNVSYLEQLDSFHFFIDLFSHLKKNIFKLDDLKLAAEEIVIFLMTD